MARSAPKHYAPGDTPADRQKRAEVYRREFDRKRNAKFGGDPHRRIYFTPQWRRIRAMVLKNHPSCATCGGQATCVDHIVPVRDAPDRAYLLSNLQPLCQSCHSRKTAFEADGFRGYQP